MTAPVDLVDEIGVSRGHMSSAEIYDMVTTNAARLLRLCDGQGSIRESGVADLIAVADRDQTPAAALREMQPQLVMTNGAIRLVAPGLLDRIEHCHHGSLYRVGLDGRGRWLTDVDIPALHEETVRALGPDYRLAGKRVSQ